MKIGIITWFTYENYGTKLQALALQEYLKKTRIFGGTIKFPTTDS